MKPRYLGLFAQMVCYITLCLLSTEVFAQVKKTTNRPAKEPYASLSLEDKIKVQKKLVAQLKVDTDFLAIEKITKVIVNDNIKRRAKDGKSKPVDRNANTPEAKKIRDGMYDVMIKNINLMKKYPEIRQLDSETRRAVFKQARAKKGA